MYVKTSSLPITTKNSKWFYNMANIFLGTVDVGMRRKPAGVFEAC